MTSVIQIYCFVSVVLIDREWFKSSEAEEFDYGFSGCYILKIGRCGFCCFVFIREMIPGRRALKRATRRSIWRCCCQYNHRSDGASSQMFIDDGLLGGFGRPSSPHYAQRKRRRFGCANLEGNRWS